MSTQGPERRPRAWLVTGGCIPANIHYLCFQQVDRKVGRCSPRSCFSPKAKASLGLSDLIWALGSHLDAHRSFPACPSSPSPHMLNTYSHLAKLQLPAPLKAPHWAGAENIEGWFKGLIVSKRQTNVRTFGLIPTIVTWE